MGRRRPSSTTTLSDLKEMADFGILWMRQKIPALVISLLAAIFLANAIDRALPGRCGWWAGGLGKGLFFEPFKGGRFSPGSTIMGAIGLLSRWQGRFIPRRGRIMSRWRSCRIGGAANHAVKLLGPLNRARPQNLPTMNRVYSVRDYYCPAGSRAGGVLR